jgi:hypothetical protein
MKSSPILVFGKTNQCGICVKFTALDKNKESYWTKTVKMINSKFPTIRIESIIFEQGADFSPYPSNIGSFFPSVPSFMLVPASVWDASVQSTDKIKPAITQGVFIMNHLLLNGETIHNNKLDASIRDQVKNYNFFDIKAFESWITDVLALSLFKDIDSGKVKIKHAANPVVEKEIKKEVENHMCKRIKIVNRNKYA